MAHVWMVEVRDRDTSRKGGWTAWRPLSSGDRYEVFPTRDEAYRTCCWLDFEHDRESVRYRVRRYDRRGTM